MKNLLLTSLCSLIIAEVAVALPQKYGPVPNYKGTKQAGVGVQVPTTGTWYVYNPIAQKTLRFGGWGGGEYWFHYTAPVFVNSYIEVDPCYPSAYTMRLVEIVAYDEEPDEPYTIPNQRGFTAADPEVTPGNPGAFFFAGKSGLHYAAAVTTLPVGSLQLPGSPVQGFDTSRIGGPPENLVHIIETIIIPTDVADFTGQFEYEMTYLGCSASGDPCMPFLHSFELSITQWDPAVEKISDIDWEAPHIVPGYVTIVTPPNWVTTGGTWGRIGYEANTGSEITVGTGTFGWTVKGKTPYVQGGHAYLTTSGTLASPVINALVVGADARIDCGSWGRLPADFDLDCSVDFQDFAIFADQWLKCTDPGVTGCTQLTTVGLGILYDSDETTGPAVIQELYDTHTTGLYPGDQIVEYCRIPITSGASLYTATETLPPLTAGQTVPVTVVRSGQVLNLEATAVVIPVIDTNISYDNRNCTQVALTPPASGTSCMCSPGISICSCYYVHEWNGYSFRSFKIRKNCFDQAGHSCHGMWLGLM